MRRQLSLKSDTCTESMDVNAAGISVKVSAHYPGRSHVMPLRYRCREAAGCDMRSQPRA